MRSYSPDLNLIERLWRFVRKEWLDTAYFDSFAPLKTAIADCLAETQGKYKADMQSLLY